MASGCSAKHEAETWLPADRAGGSASAEGGGFKLTLTNVLPGTYFALFGTVIIGIMLWQGQPQLSQTNTAEAAGNEQATDQKNLQGAVKAQRSAIGNLNLRQDGCLGPDCKDDESRSIRTDNLWMSTKNGISWEKKQP